MHVLQRMKQTLVDHDTQEFLCMVFFDSLLSFPIEMCVLIHRGSDQIEGKPDGCWYNMCEHALDYTEAEGLEDNLDEIFKDDKDTNLVWGGNSLSLVIRSKDIQVEEMLDTLCFTIRDYFYSLTGSMRMSFQTD